MWPEYKQVWFTKVSFNPGFQRKWQDGPQTGLVAAN